MTAICVSAGMSAPSMLSSAACVGLIATAMSLLPAGGQLKETEVIAIMAAIIWCQTDQSMEDAIDDAQILLIAVERRRFNPCPELRNEHKSKRN